MSLKSELFEQIKNIYPRSLSINEVEAIAHLLDRKVDNASRRLRDLMKEGTVEPIWNEKHKAIIGYRLIVHSEPFKAVAVPNIANQPMPEANHLFPFTSSRQFTN